MNSPEVAVIDYGVGNLLSVQRGVIISSEPEQIIKAKRVVLPGVGAFGNAMRELRRLRLVDAIQDIAHRQTPLLCICLGMQLLLDESEEFGLTAGLGLIHGRVIPVPTRSRAGEMLKIPHIGWSGLQPAKGSDGWHGTLLQDNRLGDPAYFVHSFMAVPADPAHRIADCLYGDHLLSAMIGRDKITGCQFHPEKSGEDGLKILRRFVTQ
jgi:glutamine amidotransferase